MQRFAQTFALFGFLTFSPEFFIFFWKIYPINYLYILQVNCLFRK
jgi:hypothetical protein